MKNYTKCKEILGEIIFNELIENLLNNIIVKFSKEINIEDFVKVLDVNISVILLLAEYEKNTNKHKLINEFNKNTKYLIIDDINKFKNWADKYIKLIVTKL